jgi:two-component system CheB/CheR fusion protein
VRRLRSLPGKENVPVVALTGYGRKEDVEQAANEGFVAHLTKPFDVGRLLAFLSQLSPGNDRVEGNFDNSNSPGNIAGL